MTCPHAHHAAEASAAEATAGTAASAHPGGVALPALFARFPDLDLAVPATELRNKPVVTQNDLFDLPVRLRV